MKNEMNCKIVSPNGGEKNIPYYQLEQNCIEIVHNFLNDSNVDWFTRLKRKKQFLLFQKQYQTFPPYFDFVFLVLKYRLINPFLIKDCELTIKQKEGIRYYFATPIDPSKELKKDLQEPILLQTIEQNIVRKPLTSSITEMETSFITEKLESIKFQGKWVGHNAWASVWNHYLIMSNKDICHKYLEEKAQDLILWNQAEFFQNYYPWIRLAKTYVTNSCFILAYHGDKIVSVQKEWIRQMCEKKIFLPVNLYDLDHSQNKEHNNSLL